MRWSYHVLSTHHSKSCHLHVLLKMWNSFEILPKAIGLACMSFPQQFWEGRDVESSLRRPLSDSNLCSPRLQDKYNAGSVHERITSRKMLKSSKAPKHTQAQQVTQQAPSQSKTACQGLHVSIRDRPSVEFRTCTGSNTKN